MRLVLAALALEGVVPQVGDGDQAAEVADVDAVGVGDLEQALAEELGRAVRYLTICEAEGYLNRCEELKKLRFTGL